MTKNVALLPRRAIAALAAALTVVLVTSVILPLTAAPARAADVTISGVVFDDYNHNGVQDAGEPGLPGVTVWATDAAGASWSGTTVAGTSGAYSINAPTASTEALRIEVVLPDGYEDSLTGSAAADSFSTVRFVTGDTTEVNFGVEQPGQYCQENPGLVTTVFCQGDGSAGGARVIDAVWHASYDSRTRTGVASPLDVGSLNAVAWLPATRSVFLGSYVKRHAGLVDAYGADALWLMDPDTNVVTHWLDLNDIGIDVGQDLIPTNADRDILPATVLSNDPVFSEVGKVGIGDLETNDVDTLYVTNLYDRHVYSLPVAADGSAPGVGEFSDLGAPGSALATEACDPTTEGTLRPFGLGFNDGYLYAGLVCDAAISGSLADLNAFVVRTTGDGNWTQIGPSIDLDYNRDAVFSNIENDPSAAINKWHAWDDEIDDSWDSGFNSGATGGADFIVRPTPMLSDIEFDDLSGAMVLAFRDRTGDMIGADNAPPNPEDGSFTGNSPAGLVHGMTGGDILRMCLVSGSYVVEGDVDCPQQESTSGDGATAYEHYVGDTNSRNHFELSNGHVAIAPRTDRVLMSSMNAVDGTIVSAGIRGLVNSTGAYDGTLSANYYSNGRPDANPSYALFSKSNGMGDIELLCDAAPLQIGNRVWEDLDGDGIQDAGEPGIAGVTVQLLDSSSAVVGTAVTNANGDYYFSTTVKEIAAGDGDHIGGGLALRERYTIRFGSAADYASGPLQGLWLTASGATVSGGDIYSGQSELVDSDPSAGTGVMGVDWFPLIAIDETKTLPGHNNHSFDAGFYRHLELGGVVFFDPDNDGVDDGDGRFESVTVLLYNGDGTPFLRSDGTQATTQTNSAGEYIFTALPAGSFIVEIPAAEFEAELEFLGSSDGHNVGGFAPIADGDDVGIDNGDPVSGDIFDGNAVRSAVVVLAPGLEPTDDPEPTVGTPDSNSNRTVDFGFWIVQAGLELGNQLWFDTNENGIFDDGEPPVPAGVVLQLFDADTDALMLTTTTDADGRYLFSSLSAGSYYVVIPGSNFETGGSLFGYVATAGAGVSDDPNNGVDSDSNGANADGGVRSAVLSFYAQMPVGEDDPWVTVSDDRLSNLTLDFGFVLAPTELIMATTGADVDLQAGMALWAVIVGAMLVWLSRVTIRPARTWSALGPRHGRR